MGTGYRGFGYNIGTCGVAETELRAVLKGLGLAWDSDSKLVADWLNERSLSLLSLLNLLDSIYYDFS